MFARLNASHVICRIMSEMACWVGIVWTSLRDLFWFAQGEGDFSEVLSLLMFATRHANSCRCAGNWLRATTFHRMRLRTVVLCMRTPEHRPRSPKHLAAARRARVYELDHLRQYVSHHRWQQSQRQLCRKARGERPWWKNLGSKAGTPGTHPAERGQEAPVPPPAAQEGESKSQGSRAESSASRRLAR